MVKKYNFIKSTIFLKIIFSIVAIVNGSENKNLCSSSVALKTEDGNPYTINILSCCEGYTDIDGKCLPECHPSCTNGKCIKPNVCECKDGYEMKEKKCLPKCKNKCINGYCSEPNVCGCLNGFKIDITNVTVCKPFCKSKCPEHATCTAPNNCECDSGYRRNGITGKCDPICKDQIKYSICIEPPNKWTCIDNYHHDHKINKCVLESCSCKSNGYCLDNKNKCECYEGFTRNKNTQQCDAVCEPKCENSICVKNNICDCVDGYHNTSIAHVCEHNSLCNGQPCENGDCLTTGECKCKRGFIKSLSYNGQLQCDKVQTFLGKVMTSIIGVPLILAIIVLFVVLGIARKKSYNVEDQEMVLIGRH